jgi:hypothetical protein
VLPEMRRCTRPSSDMRELMARIAYRAKGLGSLDLVLVPGFLAIAPQAAQAAGGESLAPRHTTYRITEDRTMTRVVKEESP